MARDSREMVPVHPIVEHSLRERSVYREFFLNVRQSGTIHSLNVLSQNLIVAYISRCSFPIRKSWGKVEDSLV